MSHIINVDNPHITSQAAAILLRRKYVKHEIDYWLEVKYNYLRKFSILACVYCGRDDLKYSSDNLNQVATIDHIIPLSKGGARFDEANFCIACRKCNSKKGDK